MYTARITDIEGHVLDYRMSMMMFRCSEIIELPIVEVRLVHNVVLRHRLT